MSRSGRFFLERQRVFIPRRHRPKHEANVQRSHFRPVRPLPELVGPDTVEDRVLTQPEEEREAFDSENNG